MARLHNQPRRGKHHEHLSFHGHAEGSCRISISSEPHPPTPNPMNRPFLLILLLLQSCTSTTESEIKHSFWDGNLPKNSWIFGPDWTVSWSEALFSPSLETCQKTCPEPGKCKLTKLGTFACTWPCKSDSDCPPPSICVCTDRSKCSQGPTVGLLTSTTNANQCARKH